MKIDPKTIDRINWQRKRRAARAAAELYWQDQLAYLARVQSADLASPGSTSTAAARTADDADPGQLRASSSD